MPPFFVTCSSGIPCRVQTKRYPSRYSFSPACVHVMKITWPSDFTAKSCSAIVSQDGRIRFLRIWIMSSSWYIDINLNLFSLTARLPLCLRYNEFTFRRGCKICYLASGWFLIITLNPFLLCLTSVALVFAFWLLNFTIQGRTRLYVTGKKFTQHYCSPARADILPTDKKKNVCAEVKKN